MRPLIALLLVFALHAHAADKTIHQSLDLPSGPLPFTAAVETLKLANPKGEAQAEIVTTAFLRDGAPPGPRAVTFVFNGGPGAASAFLNVGAIGPWRVPVAVPVVPSQDPTPIANAETWLPFTDLVFIDPPGTGYSRVVATGSEAQRTMQSVEGDIQTLSATIRRWLEAHGRQASPVFVTGESYGGFRAPLVARALLEKQGIGVSGLVLISPVLDFNGRDSAYNPLRNVAALPSIIAITRHASRRDDVQDAETYAIGDYLHDLLRGPNDAAALDRLTARVAALTGLDPAQVRRREGRLDWETVLRTRNPGSIGSPYDGTILAADPFPASPHDNAPEPLLDGLRGTITAAMLTIYHTLDWQPEGAPARQYVLLADDIAHDWDYGRRNSRPEAMTALRQFLSLDPAARVLIVHGLYDLVTPYFATQMLLDQVPQTRPPGRLTLQVLAGGHMAYFDTVSRAALRDSAAALIDAALAARAAALR